MIFDLHNDFLTELKTDKQIDYLNNNKCFLNFLCCPVFTTNLKNAKKYIENKKKILKKFNFTQICIEDVGFLNPKDFEWLKNINPLYIGFMWNNSNSYGGGAYDTGGLSTYGKDLVKFCNHNNIVIDTAHMNYKTFFDITNVTDSPLFCSHTGFCDIVRDKRNLSFYQIKDIIDSNGLVGLYFVGKYISKILPTSLDIALNIDYFVNKFGVNNLAIGSDFYGTKDLPIDVQTYGDFDVISQKLQKLGYKSSDIEKIFYKNAKNFFCSK